MKRLLPLLGLLLAACGAPGTAVVLESAAGERVTVRAELALTPADRERGLMERTSLPEGTGMLFVFPDARPLSFWMKNTKIPLDILFFDTDKRFLSAATMQPCTADPCALYSSRLPARYALEVPAGFVKRHDIAPDWSLAIPDLAEPL